MFTLTRILSLAAAGALLALTAASIPASADDSAANLEQVVPEYIDIAPEQVTDSRRNEAFPAEADGVGVGGIMSPSPGSR